MDIENEEFLLFINCAAKTGLRYMCIGGYAVNYYGFHRHTEDLDIWIAPTEENKEIFLQTLFCMGYSESETNLIRQEDFTSHFVCSLGSPPYLIDILTIIHRSLDFNEAEKEMLRHPISEELVLNIVPYSFLKEAKLRSVRQKDLYDIARLEEVRKEIK